MTDKTQVVGTLEGITEKPNGWHSIAVSVPGKNYPVKMDTKLEPLVQKAREAGGNVMVWTYSESDSGTPNPNRPGTNFVNRRFEGVEPMTAENTLPPSEGSSAPATHQPPLLGGDKDRAITRMACLKAAAETLNSAGLAEPYEDPALEVMKIAARYENWVMRDIGEVPFQ